MFHFFLLQGASFTVRNLILPQILPAHIHTHTQLFMSLPTCSFPFLFWSYPLILNPHLHFHTPICIPMYTPPFSTSTIAHKHPTLHAVLLTTHHSLSPSILIQVGYGARPYYETKVLCLSTFAKCQECLVAPLNMRWGKRDGGVEKVRGD